MLDKLHPDASLILIGRGLLVRDPEMEKNIGKTVRFVFPRGWRPEDGTLRRDSLARIVGVQRDYRGCKVYRVVFLAVDDTFGTTASPEAVEFVEPPTGGRG